MKLLSLRSSAGHVARRLFSPRLEFWRRLFRKKNGFTKSKHDEQLWLYSRILPGGFLNYGYFEDVNVQPEDISLNDIRDAQIRYAENLLALIPASSASTLDAGCGLGGLVALALGRNINITALTPNRAQAERIRQTHPGVPLIEDKFENTPGGRRFGTVITSESFQYMRMDSAFEKMEQVLEKNGVWILCDYFRTSDKRGSGHCWAEFNDKLMKRGWRITHETDITQNVLPTLRYINMWAQRLGVPLFEYSCRRFERKHPAAHTLIQDLLNDLKDKMLSQLSTISPDAFVAERKYVLLTLQRTVD